MKEDFLRIFNEKLDFDEQLNLKDSFKEYDEWDSMNTLNLMSLLDEEYDIILKREDIDGFETVEDIINFIEQGKLD